MGAATDVFHVVAKTLPRKSGVKFSKNAAGLKNVHVMLFLGARSSMYFSMVYFVSKCGTGVASRSDRSGPPLSTDA